MVHAPATQSIQLHAALKLLKQRSVPLLNLFKGLPILFLARSFELLAALNPTRLF
jgi:hypothetical protein